MEIKERKINELIPAEYNPRQLSKEQAEQLKASLQRFGAVDPAIVNTHPERKNIIVGGHQRLKTAQSIGWDTFPCVEVELDRDKERELNIRLNKNTGGWDYDALANYFEVEELTDWGFSTEELFGDIENEEVEAKEDDYEEPDEIHTDIVLGDLIEIGQHRLLCGDSTDSDQVAKLMDGQKADMVFTDPPYGMFLDTDYSKIKPNSKKAKQFSKAKGETTNKNYSKVIGDNEDFTPELINTIFACFNDCKEVFIWGADYFAELIPNKNNGSWIVWDKRTNDDGSNLDEMFGSCFELCWSKNRHKREIARVKYAGLFGTEREDTKKRLHPTQKPILLAQWFFNKWGSKNDLVADLYLGSGSTMVACHQLNRKCYGMELDPKYCQVIIDRMLKLDETLEVKINGEPYGL